MALPDYPEQYEKDMRDVLQGIVVLQRIAHQTAVDKGFWSDTPMLQPSFAECIALIHSELSEALEAARHGNPKSEKIPGFSAIEEEMADAVIRIADRAGYDNLRLGPAILAKLAYNQTRPHRHGKEF